MQSWAEGEGQFPDLARREDGVKEVVGRADAALDEAEVGLVSFAVSSSKFSVMNRRVSDRVLPILVDVGVEAERTK